MLFHVRIWRARFTKLLANNFELNSKCAYKAKRINKCINIYDYTFIVIRAFLNLFLKKNEEKINHGLYKSFHYVQRSKRLKLKYLCPSVSTHTHMIFFVTLLQLTHYEASKPILHNTNFPDRNIPFPQKRYKQVT